jgi:alkyl sulfatase BDS1-like metallo-beta-lactamase superfamily hydrolase
MMKTNRRQNLLHRSGVARGFIAKRDTLTIKKAQGQPVWDFESYKAYISLDKPAVRASGEHDEKQSQCKSGMRKMNGEY